MVRAEVDIYPNTQVQQISIHLLVNPCKLQIQINNWQSRRTFDYVHLEHRMPKSIPHLGPKKLKKVVSLNQKFTEQILFKANSI